MGKVYIRRTGLPPLPMSDGHQSSFTVTDEVVQPTRGRARRLSPPIWPCSGWGLPDATVSRSPGELLPHHFTLTSIRQLTPVRRGGMFLWHFPWGHPPWALPSILPFGARTFLIPSEVNLRRHATIRPACFPVSSVLARAPKRLDGYFILPDSDAAAVFAAHDAIDFSCFHQELR